MKIIFLIVAFAPVQAKSYTRAEILDIALNEDLSSYGLIDNGVQCNRGYCWSSMSRGMAMFYLAIETINGNLNAEYRLFEHINHLLIAGNEPDCNGTLSSRGHAQIIGALALVKSKPRLWERLRPVEQLKIETLVKGCLIATATTSSDHDNFLGGLDGCGNFNKTWNPNYREGFIGELIAAAIFLGPSNAVLILQTFECEEFIDYARTMDLPNIVKIFEETTDGIDCPTGYGPNITCSDIERVIKNYTYHGYSLPRLIDIHSHLTNYTFSGGQVECSVPRSDQIVNCANYRTGQSGWIIEGCGELPNKGKNGMLKEFNACDGGGLRSSLSYSAQGWSNNIMTAYLLNYFNFPRLPPTIEQYRDIGTTDLFYKAAHGYNSYALGKNQGIQNELSLTFGFKYAWAIRKFMWNIKSRAPVPWVHLLLNDN